MKKKVWKSALSIFLAVVLLIGSIEIQNVFAAGAEDYAIAVNGTSASGGVTVDYSETLSFSLKGYSGSATPEFLVAKKKADGSADDDWQEIKNGTCKLEPGEYYLSY